MRKYRIIYLSLLAVLLLIIYWSFTKGQETAYIFRSITLRDRYYSVAAFAIPISILLTMGATIRKTRLSGMRKKPILR